MFQPANAQITSNPGANQNIAGLIPVTLNQTLVSQIKTSLSNVTAIAEKTTGPNSYAVLAALETEGIRSYILYGWLILVLISTGFRLISQMAKFYHLNR